MNIGCDIVKNERLKNPSDEFLSKVLTDNEIVLYKEYGHQFLCGRFAAKEAIMKCLNNTKSLTFLDIEILKNDDGSPRCSIDNVCVSISHEKEYTIAYAIKY